MLRCKPERAPQWRIHTREVTRNGLNNIDALTGQQSKMTPFKCPDDAQALKMCAPTLVVSCTAQFR
jgi:hypothetical protein